MSQDFGSSGLAALSICESMLLSLTDNKIIGPSEAKAILEDAADAHRQAGRQQSDPDAHQDAAKIIDHIISGGNAVRRKKT